MKFSQRLLLIEDNRSIAGALAIALRQQYDIDRAVDGNSGLKYKAAEDYDVIVLDLSLPDMSGLDVCQRIREQDKSTPILILTAETKTLSKINLLDAGANDYVTKPFSLGELKARLRCATRNSGLANPPSHLEIDTLVLDTTTHVVLRDNQRIILRRKEFALLECLMTNAGNVVSREALSRYAWQGSDSPFTNTVDVHIKHLRDKVDRPFSQPLIKTVHGLGYRIEMVRASAV